jgi:hypothetical protein
MTINSEFKLRWYLLRYIPIAGLAVLLTFATHEFIHFLTGELLGNNMVMNLNESYPVSESYIQDWHFTVVTATAPLFTFFQTIFVFLILRQRNIPLLLPFLVSPVIMRCMALAFTFSNPNDEARLSHDAGLSVWTIPVIVCSILIYLLYSVIKKNGYDKTFVFWSTLLTIAFSITLIELNEYFLG